MMNKTSLATIRAMVELARLPEYKWEGAGSIARRIGAPSNYLGKVLQSLVSGGLVVSQKGLNGGFRLGRSPKAVTLFDIVDPIEKVNRLEGCFLKSGKCSEGRPCKAHSRWGRARKAYVQFLKGTTLKDLV